MEDNGESLPKAPREDAATAAAEPMPASRTAIADDAQALHGSRRRTGLTPLVWCSVIIVVVLAVLAWDMR